MLAESVEAISRKCVQNWTENLEVGLQALLDFDSLWLSFVCDEHVVFGSIRPFFVPDNIFSNFSAMMGSVKIKNKGSREQRLMFKFPVATSLSRKVKTTGDFSCNVSELQCPEGDVLSRLGFVFGVHFSINFIVEGMFVHVLFKDRPGQSQQEILAMLQVWSQHVCSHASHSFLLASVLLERRKLCEDHIGANKSFVDFAFDALGVSSVDGVMRKDSDDVQGLGMASLDGLEQRSGNYEKIVVITNNVTNLEEITTLLTCKKYQVFPFHGVDQVLRCLQEVPDLIVMDLPLKHGMSEEKFLLWVQEYLSDVPCLGLLQDYSDFHVYGQLRFMALLKMNGLSRVKFENLIEDALLCGRNMKSAKADQEKSKKMEFLWSRAKTDYSLSYHFCFYHDVLVVYVFGSLKEGALKNIIANVQSKILCLEVQAKKALGVVLNLEYLDFCVKDFCLLNELLRIRRVMWNERLFKVCVGNEEEKQAVLKFQHCKELCENNIDAFRNIASMV